VEYFKKENDKFFEGQLDVYTDFDRNNYGRKKKKRPYKKGKT